MLEGTGRQGRSLSIDAVVAQQEPAPAHGGVGAFVERWRKRLVSASASMWSPFMMVGALVAFGGAVQGLEWAAVIPRDPKWALLVIVPVLALAIAMMALLYWAVWRSRVRPEDPKYEVAVLVGPAALGVALVAMAGLVFFLSRQGGVTPKHALTGGDGLLTVEKQYAWQLLAAIPLVNIPQTLGWNKPDLFADHVSGGLLLAFRIAVLLPVLHVCLAGFREGEAEFSYGAVAEAASGQARKQRVFVGVDVKNWLSRQVLFFAIAGAAVLGFVSNPSSPLARLALRHTSAGLAQWVLDVLAVTGVAMVVVLFWLARQFLSWSGGHFARRLLGVASALGRWLVFLVLVTELAIAGELLLIRVGLSSPSSPSAPLQTSINFFTWHIADAVPGLDIPKTLRWSEGVTFTDRWSESLLLGYKIVVLATLALPMARAVRRYIYWSRLATEPHTAISGGETAAHGKFYEST